MLPHVHTFNSSIFTFKVKPFQITHTLAQKPSHRGVTFKQNIRLSRRRNTSRVGSRDDENLKTRIDSAAQELTLRLDGQTDREENKSLKRFPVEFFCFKWKHISSSTDTDSRGAAFLNNTAQVEGDWAGSINPGLKYWSSPSEWSIKKQINVKITCWNAKTI